MRVLGFLSVSEYVNYVGYGACFFTLEEFRISAFITGDCDEFIVLHV